MSADITERKRAEEELKKALAEVQRLKERLELENVYLRSEVLGAHRYGEIIGESEGIRKVLEEVESGSGHRHDSADIGGNGDGERVGSSLGVREERAAGAAVGEGKLFGAAGGVDRKRAIWA